ncbi:MAG TPA: FixG Ig-like domain-containing protein, partial [Pseudomonadales bacterium]
TCVDCTLCVQVCPTGIDIRDGLQYQCIGCAQCIDACDQVMEKMGYAPGLIRYTTERALKGGKTRWLRPRSVGYGLALTVMVCAFGYALVTRTPYEVDVLRERGELYENLPGDLIGNQYRLRVLNKTQDPATLTVEADSSPAVTLSLEEPVRLAPGELLDLPLTLTVPASALTASNIGVTIRVCEPRTGRCDIEETRFLGPAS